MKNACGLFLGLTCIACSNSGNEPPPWVTTALTSDNATPVSTDNLQTIFTVNGEDCTVCTLTARNDFFLDDIYSNDGIGFSNSSDSDAEATYDSTGGATITVAPEGNSKVYVVDGNIWLNNADTLSFIIASQPATSDSEPAITIVARGNIYISDNFLYQNIEEDAIAFIAVKRSEDFPDEFGTAPENPALESSGNIVFGDLDAGTTFRFAGFMFAESNFYDGVVDTTGTSLPLPPGTMPRPSSGENTGDMPGSTGPVIESPMETPSDTMIDTNTTPSSGTGSAIADAPVSDGGNTADLPTLGGGTTLAGGDNRTCRCGGSGGPIDMNCRSNRDLCTVLTGPPYMPVAELRDCYCE